MKKCMEYRVEGRRLVGRPGKTWLESVEADMAELRIDKEDVHDISKWRRNVNVMKRKSNPIGKRTPMLNNNSRYTTNIPTDPHIVNTTDIKTIMRHIHTSVVSRHLATRGNNKILRTPPPHISSTEEILPRFTRRSLAQFRTNKSPFLKSYLHKVNAKAHPSPLCPLSNTHTHVTHNIFNCTHVRTTLSPLE